VVADEGNRTGKDASVCWAPGHFRGSPLKNDELRVLAVGLLLAHMVAFFFRHAQLKLGPCFAFLRGFDLARSLSFRYPLAEQ